MEKLPMCRICLAENVRMFIVTNRNLHELYEKLTDVPFVTKDSRPILACFICCSKLKQCYRLLRQCLEAEELFAQRMNEDYEPNPLSNQDCLQLSSGFIKSPIDHINIYGEYETGSTAIKEELPPVSEGLDDVIEPKEELQSDEATIARKPKLDTRGTKEKYAIPAEQTTKDKSDSKAIEQISIGDECQTETIAVKEEIPAAYGRLDGIIEPKEEYQSDELELENLDNSCLDIADLPPHHSESDLEDDVPLMQLKIEVEDEEVSKKKPRARDTRNLPFNAFKAQVKSNLCSKAYYSINDYLHDKNSWLVGIEQISIGDECQTETIAVKEEIPAAYGRLDGIIEPKEEYQSDELELENLDNSCLDIADLPPHHSESDLEDDVPLMQLKIEVEDEEVSKKKPRARDTRKATVARKPKLDTRRTKETDAIPAEQTKKNKSDSKVIRTTQQRTSIPGTYFKEPYKFNQRNSNRVKKEYKCDVCQRSFSEKIALTRHIRTHSGEKPHKCDLCQRSFIEKCKLKIHFRTHTGEKPYKCDVCQRSYSSGFVLRKHIRIHTGIKPYKCDLCQRSFIEKCKLKIHFRTHTGEKPYKCDVCQRSFCEKGALTRHIYTHSGEKPYNCDVCQRSYSSVFGLRKHIRIHTDIKPYMCDVCQRSFIDKNMLAVHIRTHTGEKPYECDLCRRRFSQKCHLLMHIRTHTGEKPYKCDLCRCSFSSKAALTKHIYTHTDEKPYHCDLCERSYSSKFGLKRHIRIHTG